MGGAGLERGKGFVADSGVPMGVELAGGGMVLNEGVEAPSLGAAESAPVAGYAEPASFEVCQFLRAPDEYAYLRRCFVHMFDSWTFGTNCRCCMCCWYCGITNGYFACASTP